MVLMGDLSGTYLQIALHIQGPSQDSGWWVWSFWLTCRTSFSPWPDDEPWHVCEWWRSIITARPFSRINFTEHSEDVDRCIDERLPGAIVQLRRFSHLLWSPSLVTKWIGPQSLNFILLLLRSWRNELLDQIPGRENDTLFKPTQFWIWRVTENNWQCSASIEFRESKQVGEQYLTRGQDYLAFGIGFRRNSCYPPSFGRNFRSPSASSGAEGMLRADECWMKMRQQLGILSTRATRVSLIRIIPRQVQKHIQENVNLSQWPGKKH
jgi:hypothetical protein